MKLAGRTALVTGGSRGIGRGIALALAHGGASIAISYRKEEAAANEVVKAVQGLGRQAIAVKADVTEQAAVESLVGATVAAFGKLDILVNNAGIASRGSSLADTDASEMKRLLDTHIMGAFYACKAALPHLRKNPRSDIYFISSMSPHMAPAGHGPYATAKAGLEVMAKVMAMEELKNNVRVNTIAAGVVDTEMGRRLVKYTLGDEMGKLNQKFPFGRVCTPEDVGNLIAFLASNEGGYVSGHTIFLDGGDPAGVAKE
ncbi:MAG: SDR family oxidoreductase [Chloroflexi bacterium]|nr:SDR family oxidoreductase [Chloroflexota bacterium]